MEIDIPEEELKRIREKAEEAHRAEQKRRAEEARAQDGQQAASVAELKDSLDHVFGSPEKALEFLEALKHVGNQPADLPDTASNNATTASDARTSSLRGDLVWLGGKVLAWLAYSLTLGVIVAVMLLLFVLVMGERVDWESVALAGLATTVFALVIIPIAALKTWLFD